MPDYAHHFVPLFPPLSAEELPTLETLGLIRMDTSAGFTLVCRLQGCAEQIRVIAVTEPRGADQHPDHSEWHKQLVENAITAIRLSVDSEAHPIYTADGFITCWCEDDNAEPTYSLALMFDHNPDYRLNVRNVIGVYGEISNREAAPIAALVAESQFAPIPPHYRVLSAIRAIELLHQDEHARNAVLDTYEDGFRALNISTSPFRAAFYQLRTRCAHGRSRGRVNPEPFVGIGYNEPALVPLLNLLKTIVVDGLRERFGMAIVDGRDHAV